MRKKRRKDRLYFRERGGVRRWYADFRDFDNVGGGREALKADGERGATTDEIVAEILVARRLEELDALRNGRAIHGDEKHATLAQFARQHLIAKAEEGAVTDSWLEATEGFLSRALEFWGAQRDLR